MNEKPTVVTTVVAPPDEDVETVSDTLVESAAGDAIRAETAAVVAEQAAEGAVALAATQAALAEMDAAARIAGFEEWQSVTTLQIAELSASVQAMQAQLSELAARQSEALTLPASDEATVTAVTISPADAEGGQEAAEPVQERRERYRLRI